MCLTAVARIVGPGFSLPVVVATGLLYAGGALLLHAQLGLQTTGIFPDSGFRANLASIAASLLGASTIS